MKRVLAIILAGGILTFAVQLEVLARGGGGRGGGGGGGGGARRWRWRRWRCECSVPAEGSPRRREPHVRPVRAASGPSGGQAAASRPAAPQLGQAKAARKRRLRDRQRRALGPAQAADKRLPRADCAKHAAEHRRRQDGCHATCGWPPTQWTGCGPPWWRVAETGRAAAQRPAAGAGAANVAAGSRPTAGQVNNFLDVPGPATGAAGAASGRARERGGAAADFLQGGGAAVAAGAAVGGAAVAASRARQTLVGPELRGRICRRIARNELKTAASGKVTVTSGATKSAINMSRTTPAISGRRILAGLLGRLRAPSRGRIGVRWEAGAAIAANQRPTATVKTSITRTTRSTPATSRSPRPKNMPQQAEEIATAEPSAEPAERRLAAVGRFCDHAGRPGHRRRAVAVHAACDQQAGRDFRHTQEHAYRQGSVAGRNGRQEEPASGLGCR